MSTEDKNISIPRNLVGIVDFVSQEPIRISLSGVYVGADGKKLKLSASDGKRMLIITERDDDHAEKFRKDARKNKRPLKPTVAKNGAHAAIVPSKTWKKAFASTGSKDVAHRDVDVVHGSEVVELLAYDGESEVSFKTSPVQGTFPDTDAVEPKDKKPLASVVMNPQLLGSALLTISRMLSKYRCAVRIEIYPDNAAMKIIAKTDEHDLKAFVMPMVNFTV